MKLLNQSSIIYYPSIKKNDIEDTTYLCVAAHQDDIEIMAYSQIAECYNDKNKNFVATVTTNGSGSPRTGKFKNYTDEQMILTRIDEQKQAADIGHYKALFMLMYPSSTIKDFNQHNPIEDLKNIILLTRPKVILTHNLMDKHPSHVASAIKVIQALKELKDIFSPEKVIGLEVWRGLDWLSQNDKLCFDTTKNKRLQKDLLNVFESQVQGGKRYDLAAIGRRYANATFFESHSTDDIKSLNYGVDMTEFVYSDKTYSEFVCKKINNFKNEAISQLDKLVK